MCVGLLPWLRDTDDSSGLTRTTFITAFFLDFTYHNLCCSMVLQYDHQVVYGFLSSPLKPDTPASHGAEMPVGVYGYGRPEITSVVTATAALWLKGSPSGHHPSAPPLCQRPRV